MSDKLSDLSRDDLVTKANELCRKCWGVDYTGTFELVNRNWRRRNGYFRYSRNDKSVQIICMSKKRNDERTPEKVYGTLLHELVHWRLYTHGIPCSDDDREFVEECIRVGAPFSNTKIAQFAAKKYESKITKEAE